MELDKLFCSSSAPCLCAWHGSVRSALAAQAVYLTGCINVSVVFLESASPEDPCSLSGCQERCRRTERPCLVPQASKLPAAWLLQAEASACATSPPRAYVPEANPVHAARRVVMSQCLPCFQSSVTSEVSLSTPLQAV